MLANLLLDHQGEIDLLCYSKRRHTCQATPGPSRYSYPKTLKTRMVSKEVRKDKLTIAYLEGTRLERLKVQYKIDVELEYHVSQLKAAVLSEAQWNSDEGDISTTEEKRTLHYTKHYAARYYNEGIKDRIPLKDRTKKFVAITLKLLMVYTIGKRIYFEAL
ncbi:hypothetical protein Tco_0662215 [Tanacetum coccineum]